jgi:UDP-GlcNAc3NAcA epimerase
MMKTILTVVGARPQFIKAAVVSRLLARQTELREFMVHTGQHYDDAMSDVFFRELEIPAPQASLQVGSGSHGAQTGRMLEQIERVLLEENPAAVLVYGDTNSTLAGALAAAKLHIPVAHVEAGLRSYNRRMPEEVNRVLTDHVSDLLFTPTQIAFDNLVAEGLASQSIVEVGDVMYDASLYFASKTGSVDRFGVDAGGYLLATVHRAENTDDPERLKSIIDGLNMASTKWPVVLPLHPRTRKRCAELGLATDHLHVIDPVGYQDMTLLEQHAALVVTDSGGVQKEAFFHGVPCLTLRTETEWVELVELGWNRLADLTNAASIYTSVESAILAGTGSSARPYGDGHAGEKIVQTLLESYG